MEVESVRFTNTILLFTEGQNSGKNTKSLKFGLNARQKRINILPLEYFRLWSIFKVLLELQRTIQTLV